MAYMEVHIVEHMNFGRIRCLVCQSKFLDKIKYNEHMASCSRFIVMKSSFTRDYLPASWTPRHTVVPSINYHLSSSTSDVTEAFQRFGRIVQNSKELSEKVLRFAETQQELMLMDKYIEKMRKKKAENKNLFDAEIRTLEEEDKKLKEFQEKDNGQTKGLVHIQIKNELEESNVQKLTMQYDTMVEGQREEEERQACEKLQNAGLAQYYEENKDSYQDMEVEARRAEHDIQQLMVRKEELAAEANQARHEYEMMAAITNREAEKRRKILEEELEQNNELEAIKKELEASLKEGADLRAHLRRIHQQMAPTGFDVPTFPNLSNPLAAGPAPPAIPQAHHALMHQQMAPTDFAVPIFPNLSNPLAAGPAPPAIPQAHHALMHQQMAPTDFAVPIFPNLSNPLAAGPAPPANPNAQNQEMEEDE